MKKQTTVKIVRAAIIAAVYATLTLALYPLSFSIFQVRVSEAMTLLPLIFPEAVAGLTIGCLIANCFAGNIFDLILGTLASLIAAIMTCFIGKKIKNEPLKIILGCIPPILVNALIVPLALMAASCLTVSYFMGVISIFVGQAIAVIAVGVPMYFILKHTAERHSGGNGDKENET